MPQPKFHAETKQTDTFRVKNYSEPISKLKYKHKSLTCHSGLSVPKAFGIAGMKTLTRKPVLRWFYCFLSLSVITSENIMPDTKTIMESKSILITVIISPAF